MKKVNPSPALSRALGACVALSVALALGCTPAWAQPDLFPATEVTAQYNPFSWFQKTKADAFAAIEPAAGEEATASTETLKAEEPARKEKAEHEAEAGHTPAATGKNEGQKSFNGKVIGTPPPLPKVTIGGLDVVSNAAQIAAKVKESTPASLTRADMQETLNHRFQITTYSHNPQEILHPPVSPTSLAPGGIIHAVQPITAPVSVVEFVDLSCGQCMEEMSRIDAAMQDISATILVTHIHAPMGNFQDTNMPAFYGKVADKLGVFWAYRASLIQDKPADANAMFEEMVKAGVNVTQARSLMLTDARRFYRELDADALLSRSLGVSKPPVLFVNGIRVGENGIPLSNLSDVLKYVDGRMSRGLPEPPK